MPTETHANVGRRLHPLKGGTFSTFAGHVFANALDIDTLQCRGGCRNKGRMIRPLRQLFLEASFGTYKPVYHQVYIDTFHEALCCLEWRLLRLADVTVES